MLLPLSLSQSVLRSFPMVTKYLQFSWLGFVTSVLCFLMSASVGHLCEEVQFHNIFLPLRQVGQAGSHFLLDGPGPGLKNGAKFFCTWWENILTHRFILSTLSVGKLVWFLYSEKRRMNGSHPKASWSCKYVSSAVQAVQFFTLGPLLR